MKFELFVPGKIWSINAERSMHYRKRAALVSPVRTASMLLAADAMRAGTVAPYWGPVTVTFRPHQATANLADTANHLPACKAALDGIVDAGILHDDDSAHVVAQTFLAPVKAKPTGVTVVVESADEQDSDFGMVGEDLITARSRGLSGL